MPEFSNTAEFIKKAKEVHNNKYDYSKVLYKRAIEKVEIICPTHSSFFQQPNNHLTGYGCKKCAIEETSSKKTHSLQEFINKSNILHNYKYDYSLVKYKNNSTLVKIICPEHDIFEQVPKAHLIGKGCKKCAVIKHSESQSGNTEDFIRKANIIHNFKYNYDKVIYKRQRRKIIINCPIHGDFEQDPVNHLRGSGCLVCGKIVMTYAYLNSIDKDISKIPCSFYIINIYDDNEDFYKVGISSNIKNRFGEIKALYKINILHIFETNLLNAVNVENKILKDFKNFKYKPNKYFEGRTECLNKNINILDLIKIKE